MTRVRDTYIGPYRVDVKLGDGGMGIVYKVVDPKLKRFVALKVLKENLACNRRYLERLDREARSLASVSHPAVVQVFSFEDGENDPKVLPYLVMEYVDGESLESLLERQTRLDVDRSIDLIRQAAEGLRAAHEAGIIHRDVKPSNLLLDSSGKLRIVDFGLAKAVDSGTATALTEDGIIIGTPQYISPEQGVGESVDHRCDIYSLGATFYHLVTGKIAFDGDSHAAIIYAHVHQPPVPPHKVNEDVPRRVSQVIGKMMAKSPGDRYADYDDLLADIEKLEKGETPSRRTMAVARDTFRRKPLRSGLDLVWMATTAAVVAVVVLGALFAKGTFREPRDLEFLEPFLYDDDHLLHLDFKKIDSEAPAGTLGRIFLLPSPGSSPPDSRPQVRPYGLTFANLQEGLTYRYEVAAVSRVHVRGLSLRGSERLALSIRDPAGEQVRRLDFVFVAGAATRVPLQPWRHGDLIAVAPEPPPVPPLGRGKYDVFIDLEAAHGETKITLTVVKKGSDAPAYPKSTFTLQGADWTSGVFALRSESSSPNPASSIEALDLRARVVKGRALDTPPRQGEARWIGRAPQ